MARRLTDGSRLGPLGTAQLFITPSSSRRRSKWTWRAACFWTTKRSVPVRVAVPPAGSAVRVKSRLLRYSPSFGDADFVAPAALATDFFAAWALATGLFTAGFWLVVLPARVLAPFATGAVLVFVGVRGLARFVVAIVSPGAAFVLENPCPRPYWGVFTAMRASRETGGGRADSPTRTYRESGTIWRRYGWPSISRRTSGWCDRAWSSCRGWSRPWVTRWWRRCWRAAKSWRSATGGGRGGPVISPG